MFNTKVEIAESSFSMSYRDSLLALGSCFAENIGKKMEQVWFDTDVNPFGVLFNPESIANSLARMLSNKLFAPDDLFLNKELWSSFAHSTQFSSVSQADCLSKVNSRLSAASERLRTCSYLLITFGTAWVYEDISTKSVVANCHKLPAAHFFRRKLTVDEIVFVYRTLLVQLKELNPELRIIFSVSPVRHWKDGAHENNLSKSTLLMAVDELEQEFDFVTYFPAYEIQMDELRDYRFYAQDMLHPSEQAVDYIWQRFADTYFDDSTRELKQEIEKYNHGLMHRPLFPQTEEYQKFQLFLEKKQEELHTRLKKIRM